MRILKIAVVFIALIALTWSTVELTIGWTVVGEMWQRTMYVLAIFLAFSPIWFGLLYGIVAGLITHKIPDGFGPAYIFFGGIPAMMIVLSFLVTHNVETVFLALCMLISYTAAALTTLFFPQKSSG